MIIDTNSVRMNHIVVVSDKAVFIWMTVIWMIVIHPFVRDPRVADVRQPVGWIGGRGWD